MIYCRGVLFCLLLWPELLVAYQLPSRKWSHDLKTGYKRRVAADPSFPAKSITEVLLAAGTQLTAEWTRRGTSRLMPEIDFVIPAILTAMFGYVCAVP